MLGRTALVTRVYTIANSLNIEIALVDRIVKAYLTYCKEELSRGHRVNLCGIAIIVPDYEVFDYKTTLAYRCKQIADMYALPQYTVFQVVQGYLDTIKDDIYAGKSANVYGLCTIQPLREGGIVTRVHSSISQSLQEYLEDYGNHARVYTNKIFKRKVKGAGIS